MTKQLPVSPNIRHLKNQSKQLLKLWLAFDSASIAQLRELHPSFQNIVPAQLASKMNLHNAQLSIARSYGFQNWGSLCSCVGAMAHADLSALMPNQVFALLSCSSNGSPANANLIVANTEKLTNYEKGRPRRENGGIVLTEKQGLTLEEALNDRAKLHGMPPIGTAFTNKHGLDWKVESYAFFVAPTSFARYPGDCDYLPIVEPQNISPRLRSFISEVDRCTSKWILFLDTMPVTHPFRLGHHIHCAHLSSDPEEAHLFLDVQNLHETTFAHELAHLWLAFVEDGDGGRVLRDRSDNGKVNQLDFVQSFVLDVRVNELIEQRGFDMALISQDQINGLEALRGAIMLGHQPPTRREMLLYCLQIAAVVLEQKRWPKQMQARLPQMLDFFEAAVPEIYITAMEFVEIVSRYGVDSKDAVRHTLDECISLGFRFTGDDFDLDLDLQDVSLTECMQDKYPEQFAGCPVALKLEIGKTMARYGISGEGKICLSASPSGRAMLTVEDSIGNKIGPLPVNYQITHHSPIADNLPQLPRALVGGKIPDAFGRLPGEPYYNTALPPGKDPISLVQNSVNNQRYQNGMVVPGPSGAKPIVKGMIPDCLGRLAGEFGYMTALPHGHPDLLPSYHPIDQAQQFGNLGPAYGRPQVNGANRDHFGRLPGEPGYMTGLPPHHHSLPSHNPNSQGHQLPHLQSLPSLPDTNSTRRYMAGVALSVAQTRLEQQMAMNSTNLYLYANNNPVRFTDPSGLDPVGWDPGRPGIPNLPCKSMKPKPICYQCAYDYYFALGFYATACELAKRACGSHTRCDRDPVKPPTAQPPACPRPQTGPNWPSFGVAVGAGTNFPWGTVLEPVGGCDTSCFAVMAVHTTGGLPDPVANWQIKICELFCSKIRSVGCDAFRTWCTTQGEEFRTKVCEALWADGCLTEKVLG